jgi:mRNA-degrading endonuclease RelE of RelBE toxin-antitoxin system
MKIVYSRKFKKHFKDLPREIQKLYEKQEALFEKNWRDPRLKVKKLVQRELVFSFRITRGYRILFTFIKTDVVLFARIGHRKNIYD